MNKTRFMKRLLCLILALSVLVPMTFTTNTTKAETYSNGVSNNRSYEWYMDQGDTGTYSEINCGPTSLAMILKWVNRNSTETGLSLRNQRINNGDWWSTTIIQEFLRRKGVSYMTYRYSENTLLNEVKYGRIALVCLDMSRISRNYNPTTSNAGRFYDHVTGHFIVVKGYRYINNVLYFEAYDPFSMGETYSNGQPLGKDRLYKASELSNAVNNWWRQIYTFR